LAAEIKKEFGVESRLVKGSGGVFNVIVGNEKIYSKHDSGRFPDEREIIEKLRGLA
jgi:selT/selW/selH-like putative selenoprotein